MRLWHAAALGVLFAVLGCGVHAQKKPERTALRHYFETRSARQGTPDPEGAARALEAGLTEHCDAATLLELADLCFRAAHRAGHDDLMTWYRDAAVYAIFAIEAGAEGDDFCQAQDIHNRSVEHLLRLAQDPLVRHRRSWQSTLRDLDIDLAGPPFLAPERFDALQPAQDYQVKGMSALYRDDGLGMPVVAYRHNDRECPEEPMDRFFSNEVNAAATAVLHPCGTPCDWRHHAATLKLYDPFESRTVVLPDLNATVGGRTVPLASDRSTPLAVQEQFSSLEMWRRVGLFRPDRVFPAERGVYMYQPYRPGKIPIVLVHGIYSSPSTWMRTVNRLQNDPELAERYQVWLFLYPTGAPITASSADMRNALRNAIAQFDPCGNDPALREMVLVGHSMGGLVCKMAVMDSGDKLWNAYFDKPFDEVIASPQTKARLEESLFLKPEPYVQRLIMIGAPHRGSFEACCFPGHLLQVAIHRPQELRDMIAELGRDNGRDVAAPGARIRLLNGVGSLNPKDATLKALLDVPICVPFHSIIPQITILGHQLHTDIVVRYSSSHLEGAESEKITTGIHTTHDGWQVTKEIERILHEHLAAIDRASAPNATPR